MKTILYLVCCLTMVMTLAGCKDGDDGGTAGGKGDWPTVSFQAQDTDNDGVNDSVICYNADSNTITTAQKCVWRCAYYVSSPQYVELTFDTSLVCTETATSETTETTGAPATTTTTTNEECAEELALVDTKIKPCFWR